MGESERKTGTVPARAVPRLFRYRRVTVPASMPGHEQGGGGTRENDAVRRATVARRWKNCPPTPHGMGCRQDHFPAKSPADGRYLAGIPTGIRVAVSRCHGRYNATYFARLRRSGGRGDVSPPPRNAVADDPCEKRHRRGRFRGNFPSFSWRLPSRISGTVTEMPAKAYRQLKRAFLHFGDCPRNTTRHAGLTASGFITILRWRNRVCAT